MKLFGNFSSCLCNTTSFAWHNSLHLKLFLLIVSWVVSKVSSLWEVSMFSQISGIYHSKKCSGLPFPNHWYFYRAAHFYPSIVPVFPIFLTGGELEVLFARQIQKIIEVLYGDMLLFLLNYLRFQWFFRWRFLLHLWVREILEFRLPVFQTQIKINKLLIELWNEFVAFIWRVPNKTVNTVYLYSGICM